MEILIMSFFAAFAKIIFFTAVFGGVRRMLWWSKAIDIFVLFFLPWLFYGTFSGVILAIMSGLWITMTLALLKTFITPKPPAFARFFHERKNRRGHRQVSGPIADCSC